MIQAQPKELDWLRLVVQAALIVVPIIAAGVLGYQKLWWTLTEYRPHAHREKNGPLRSEGIAYPRNMRDKQ